MASLVLKGLTDYSSKTSSRPCKVVVNNKELYISKPLASGNSKLASSILVFDLLAGESCKNCSECIKTCYAMKAQRQYPDTYNKRAVLTWLAKNDLPALQKLLVVQLNKTKRTIVRIHSSGDFVSQEYIDMWSKIVEIFPKIKFYYYTKVRNLFNFSELNGWSNCNEVSSILPDGSINYGDMEYLTSKVKKYPFLQLCPDGIQPDTQCGVTCTACLEEKYMLFLKH